MSQLVLNELSYNCYVGERNVELTALEYRLLEHLVQNAEAVVSVYEIIEVVWGEESIYMGKVDDSRVQKLISRIRDKIGNGFIETKRGCGYYFSQKKSEGDLILRSPGEIKLVELYRYLSNDQKRLVMLQLQAWIEGA